MNLQPIGSDAPSQEPMLAAYDEAMLDMPPVAASGARPAPPRARTIHADTVKAAVAEIESAYSAILALAREYDRAAALATEEANRRVDEVKAEADAAVQRAQLQEQIRTSELHEVIDRLRRELETERRNRWAAQPGKGTLSDDESSNPSNAPSSVDPSTVAALQAELEAARSECEELTRQLQSERAKRARFIGVVRALQQPLAVAESRPIADVPRPHGGDAAPQAECAIAADPNHAATTLPSALDEDSTRDAEPVDLAVTERASDLRAETAALHFDAREYARQLLEELESIYTADDAAGMPPTELVTRLAGNLSYAADVFDRRTGSTHPERLAFDRQLAIVMDERAATPFGRHLAVAAYDYEQRKLRSHVA